MWERYTVLVRVALVALAVSLGLGVAATAHGTHRLLTPSGRTLLWSDLEAGGDGRITYKLCGSPIQAEWSAGAEAWDVALGSSKEFDEVPCSSTADLRVTWETAGVDECAATQLACFRDSGTCTIHGPHCHHRPPSQQGNVRILFDVVNYGPPDSGGPTELPDTFEWRKWGMLHEWGHNMGLEHHLEGDLVNADCSTQAPPCWDCNGSPQPGFPNVMDGFVFGRGPNTCPQTPGGPEIKSVLCDVYGCHPNGAFVHTPSTVYVIQGNQKRPVPDSVVLTTWSDFSDVIPITDDEAKAYLDGPQVGFRPGKLIASGGAVFLITNDGSDWYRAQKRWVSSPSVLSQCFPNVPITSVDAGLANLHTNGPAITGCPPLPNGTVGYVPNVAVYLLHQNQKRWVISPAVQNSWFFGPDLVPLFCCPTQANNIGFRPGRLIRKSSTGEIFFVTNEGDFGRATKRYVSNPTTLNCLFPGEPWIEASNDEANGHPTGTPLNIPAC